MTKAKVRVAFCPCQWLALLTCRQNNRKWLAAEAAYNNAEGAKNHKSRKSAQQPVSKVKKKPKVRVSRVDWFNRPPMHV
jgi:hypothetical protein